MRRMLFLLRGRFIHKICFLSTFMFIIILSCQYIINSNQMTSESELWKQKLINESKHLNEIVLQDHSKKFLTIGIPTVYRREKYLKRTLEGFINESTAEERENVTIILYLGDLDFARRNLQMQLITQNFAPYIISGFIQIICPNLSIAHEIYPNLNFTSYKNKYNDPVERVRWRFKQSLDFAVLLSHVASVNISEYFMVMEDDVEPSPQYLTTIKEYIRGRNDKWIALEFTEFLCIGLCFHTSSLSDLAQYLLLFYKDQPVDLLMRQFITTQMQTHHGFSVKRKIPSVFQHFGKNSTLKHKVQNLYDFSFEISRRKIKNTNPPAILNTSMKIYEECIPQNAYTSTPGFFWGIPSKKTEYINIIFKSSFLVTQIVIFSGGIFPDRPTLRKDFIKIGHLEMSQESNCTNFSKLENFVNGKLNLTLITPVQMTCLQIVISNTDNSRVVVSEIEIFTETNNK